MKENTQEKSLIIVNENSIFYRIKNFFRNIFHKNKSVENTSAIANSINNSIDKKNLFIESLKNIESEETKLLKFQKQYRNGKIVEKLTEEKIDSLISLYNKQIEKLKKSNQIRKKEYLIYRKNKYY